MEILHSSSFNFPKSFEKLIKIAKDNSFYITGGSDSHGKLLKPYFSEVFPKRFSLDVGLSIMAMHQNLFADKICNKTLKNNYTCKLPFEQQVKVVEMTNGYDRQMTLEQIYERNSVTIARETPNVEVDKQSKEHKKTPQKPKDKQKNKKHQNAPIIKSKNEENNDEKSFYAKKVSGKNKNINMKKIYDGTDDSYYSFEKIRKRKVDPDQEF